MRYFKYVRCTLAKLFLHIFLQGHVQEDKLRRVTCAILHISRAITQNAIPNMVPNVAMQPAIFYNIFVNGIRKLSMIKKKTLRRSCASAIVFPFPFLLHEWPSIRKLRSTLRLKRNKEPPIEIQLRISKWEEKITAIFLKG